jgi:hypothetical protein
MGTKDTISTEEIEKLLSADTASKKRAGRGVFKRKSKTGRVGVMRTGTAIEDKLPSEEDITHLYKLLESPVIRSIVLEHLGAEVPHDNNHYEVAAKEAISNIQESLATAFVRNMSNLYKLADEFGLQQTTPELTLEPPEATKLIKVKELRLVDVSKIRFFLKKKLYVSDKDIRSYLFQLAYEVEVKWNKTLGPTSLNKKDELSEARPFIYGKKRLWKNWALFWVDYRDWKKEVQTLGIKVLK